MASPGNRHCAYCIGALSFLIDTATLMVLLNSASARAIDEARGVMFSVCPSMCACLSACSAEAFPTGLPSASCSCPEVQARRAYVLLVFYFIYFSDFCQTNYLNVYRTDLHEICRIGWTLAVDERSEVIFSISQGTLPWQPILWAKSTSNTHLVVRMTFARAAPPAYVKNCSCCAGRRQTNYLIRWTQANQLSSKLTVVDGRLEG